MNKPYLLIAGWKYYPCQSTGDWVGRYETKEKAEEAYLAYQEVYEEHYGKYWHTIVNLETWEPDNG